MSAMQRNKGKAFEQAIARDLREIFGAEVRRGWQAREGSDDPDIICPMIAPECKHQIRPNIPAALEQALRATPPDKYAVAVTKANRSEPLATMRWADFLDLVQTCWQLMRR